MADFTIDGIADALCQAGPVSLDELVAYLGAELRTGVWHPDFAAALNFGQRHGRFRFRPDDCTWEHNGGCVLEVVR
jgi:hypothetical protein